jgi:hypothetical protein
MMPGHITHSLKCMEFGVGIICEELSRIPALRSYQPLVAALATNGICTMTAAVKRIGVRAHYGGSYAR